MISQVGTAASATVLLAENKAEVLPNFIIAGERRCGTTSLYHWLKSHPDVYLYHKSDMNYFIEDELTKARTWRDGEGDAHAWEASHTEQEYAAMFREGLGFGVRGHKGADLLFWRPAHPRIARFLPNVRIIVTLRNPVERAWSHYWNEVGKGREDLDFQSAVRAEKERCQNSAYARLHLSYLSRGFYEQSIRALFDYFPSSSVLITTLEKIQRSPEETLREIFQFLGIDSHRGFEKAGTRHNQNWTLIRRKSNSRTWDTLENVYSRITEGMIKRLVRDTETKRRAREHAYLPFRKPIRQMPVPEDIRAQLTMMYVSHNKKLEQLLGRNLDEWN